MFASSLPLCDSHCQVGVVQLSSLVVVDGRNTLLLWYFITRRVLILGFLAVAIMAVV